MLEEKAKPVFDEQALAKLLEAAFVVQEHNRSLQALGLRLEHSALRAKRAESTRPANDKKPEAAQTAPADKSDYTVILAQIVETQHQIQSRHLELDSAIALIAERASQIAHAGGAGTGMVGDGGKIRYKTAAGMMSLPVATETPQEKAICLECLRGKVVRWADVNSGSFPAAEECRRRGIQAVIAVPVYRDGSIAGALELYYANKNAFTEQDVHSCQLMAGLITEALARSEEINSKKSLASERAVMLEALEKLKPNLASLADANGVKVADGKRAAPATAAPASFCRKCGNELVGREQFCGKCGLPRSGDYEPPTMQSKLASLWHMQQALEENALASPANGAAARAEQPKRFHEDKPEKILADSVEEEMAGLFGDAKLGDKETDPPAQSLDSVANGVNLSLPAQIAEESEVDESPASERVPTDTSHASNWTSAANARAFLEQLAAVQPPSGFARFWNARRGDFYLAIAVILVACVIRWGIWSSHSAGAAGNQPTATAQHRKPAPTADLSLFDRMLIGLGLAEAPEPPEYKGNPETQVWVDLHTALYYCPGTDLYGKTPKGKFTKQRDAQLDQFEPAYQKAWD